MTTYFGGEPKIIEIFYSPEDERLGLYRAFGYDLVFQFESTIEFSKERLDTQEDLVLFLPDKLCVNDRNLNEQYTISYDFKTTKGSTIGLSREERKTGLYDRLEGSLELPNGIQSHDTFGCVFANIDPEVFHNAFLEWVSETAQIIKGQVISLYK